MSVIVSMLEELTREGPVTLTRLKSGKVTATCKPPKESAFSETRGDVIEAIGALHGELFLAPGERDDDGEADAPAPAVEGS
tara:strand:- start:232 stop:474 length:243 start_codon:yes stop_codon:yes gene_type:complete